MKGILYLLSDQNQYNPVRHRKAVTLVWVSEAVKFLCTQACVLCVTPVPLMWLSSGSEIRAVVCCAF